MFNFDLPQKRIAKKPAENREDAKLMIVNRETGEINHKKMSDFQEYFDDGDVRRRMAIFNSWRCSFK